MQQPNQISPAQANVMARSMITGRAIKRTQTIYAKTIDTSTETVLDINPRNTGLILGFIVNVRQNFAVAATTGTALTRTPWGASNLVSKFTFFDLNNNTRLNTTGWHVGMVNSMRASRPYLGVDTFTDYPVSYGDYSTKIVEAAASIAQAANADTAFTYFVPISYSDTDLRGSIYANVVNATMSLQITLNQNAVQAKTVAGWHDAVYTTTSDATPVVDVTEGNVDVEVIQVYYDQLPAGQNGVILPVQDLSTIYELKNTAVTGITANQDFPIAYSNFRDFLSTTAVFRNSVETNGFAAEGDVNSWSLQSANYTDVFDVKEYIAKSWNRQTFGQDAPEGVFTFSTRQKPISTVQYGNMNLVLDAASVDAGANVLLGYEAFALTNVIGQAGSLTPGA
tara:strand:- start:7834 stop:9018 length:1185 start_codon:yes stop_codon:yes gene_type:complete